MKKRWRVFGVLLVLGIVFLLSGVNVNAGVVPGSPHWKYTCAFGCTPRILGGTPWTTNTFFCDGFLFDATETDYCVNGVRLIDYMCGGGYTSLWYDEYDCDGITPKCVNGRCVQCTVNSECSAGRICSSERCTCPGSYIDAAGHPPNGLSCGEFNQGVRHCWGTVSWECGRNSVGCPSWIDRGSCPNGCDEATGTCKAGGCKANGLSCSAPNQ